MIYFEWSFEITPMGLRLCDRAEPNDSHQVQIKNTSFKPGDTFTLELDRDNCMFFKKNQPVQLELFGR